MEIIGKALAIAVVLFFVALGILVGVRIDQDTIALLGGTTLGLLVATPCVAIGTYYYMRVLPAREQERKEQALEQLRRRSYSTMWTPPIAPAPPTQITNNYFTVYVAPGAQSGEAVIATMLQLGVSREQAKGMLATGEISLLIAGPSTNQAGEGR